MAAQTAIAPHGGTISSPAHAVRVRLLAAGTLSGVRHGENCGESWRTRSSKHALWHSTGGSAQRGDSHDTTSTCPFSTKPTADATRKGVASQRFCGISSVVVVPCGPGKPRGGQITGLLLNLHDSASSRRPRSRSKPKATPARRLLEFKAAPNHGSNRVQTRRTITRTTRLSPLQRTVYACAFRGSAGLRAFHKTSASLLNANLIHGRHRLDRSYFRFARSDEVFLFLLLRWSHELGILPARGWAGGRRSSDEQSGVATTLPSRRSCATNDSGVFGCQRLGIYFATRRSSRFGTTCPR